MGPDSTEEVDEKKAALVEWVRAEAGKRRDANEAFEREFTARLDAIIEAVRHFDQIPP